MKRKKFKRLLKEHKEPSEILPLDELARFKAETIKKIKQQLRKPK